MARNLFPQHTAMMRVQDAGALRRFSQSIVEMALITGVLVRVLRSVVLSHTASGLVFVVSLTLAALFLVAMSTAHLANFPLYRWTWRAPAFVGLEVAGEMLTSLFLIWLAREPYGSARAHFADWPGMAFRTLIVRGAIVLVWALILAVIVQVVRKGHIVNEDAELGTE